MFPVICRQQEHPGTKEPLINSFIGIMTLYCVAMENVSAIITYLKTWKEFIINVMLLQAVFVWSRPDKSGCVKKDLTSCSIIHTECFSGIFLFSLKQLSPSPERPTSQSHLSNSNYAISFQAFNRSFCPVAACLWDPAADSVKNLKRELLEFFTFTSFSTKKWTTQTKAAWTNTSSE